MHCRSKIFRSFFFITGLLSMLISSIPTQQQYYEFLPLRTGNVWIYYNWGMLPGPNKSKLTVTGTHIYGGKLYYDLSLQFVPALGCQPNPFTYSVSSIRVDSTGGIVSFHNTVNCGSTPLYIQLDSLASRLNNSFTGNCNVTYTCVDTNNYNIFGALRQTRKYRTPGTGEFYSRRYVKGIGIYEQTHSIPGIIDCNSVLYGAVINGTVTGDTSFIVGIIKINENIPMDFRLFNNYPNPFNPSTKIRFDISGTSAAQTFLSVYDILGREITTLVNQQLQPGTYEVDFDGSSYTSGIYFYKLTAGEFTSVYKMVLLK